MFRVGSGWCRWLLVILVLVFGVIDQTLIGAAAPPLVLLQRSMQYTRICSFTSKE
jgi:hypothetical protein